MSSMHRSIEIETVTVHLSVSLFVSAMEIEILRHAWCDQQCESEIVDVA
jgi:hypothetical protein